jgi:phosphoglycolate phosphatase
MAPEAILFDLDGTLVDSRRDLAASVNFALRALALPERPAEEIFGFIGEGARRLLERSVAPRLEALEPALAAWSRHYAEHLLDTTRAYPGVAELLDRLRPPLAVHTNKPGDFARRILDGLGLAPRFAQVVGGGDGPARKPDPEGARAILARLGVAPDRAVYVGDSHIDVATAHAAGLRFVGVAWGLGGEARLRDAGASEIVATSEELWRALC